MKFILILLLIFKNSIFCISWRALLTYLYAILSTFDFNYDLQKLDLDSNENHFDHWFWSLFELAILRCFWSAMTIFLINNMKWVYAYYEVPFYWRILFMILTWYLLLISYFLGQSCSSICCDHEIIMISLWRSSDHFEVLLNPCLLFKFMFLCISLHL